MQEIVNWREIEADLEHINRLYGTELLAYETIARHLADRINDRYHRKSKRLFDVIQEYRELRETKNRNDHDKL